MRYYILAIIVLGCGPSQPGPVPPPTPVVVDTDQCGAAGSNIAKVCPELAATPSGKSFAAFCEETQDNGIALNPVCLAAAKSCAEMDSCLWSQ